MPSPPSSPSSKCKGSKKCVSNCAAYGRVCPIVAEAAGRAASKAIGKMRHKSQIISSNDNDKDGGDNHTVELQKFKKDDIIIRDRLGEGGFSYVHSCVVNTGPQTGQEFAVKYLKRQIMVDKRRYAHGASDLVIEAIMLSVLDHPTIIKLHGMTDGSMEQNIASGEDCGFFLVVDRLFETLEKKIEGWRDEQEKSNGSGGFLSRITSSPSDHQHTKDKKTRALHDRVKIAWSIADALEYLHSKNIVFRDLKPDNIGFDENGNVKLFDFGLAKELKEEDKDYTGRYNVTGNTGSRRYMAPEVAKDLPYNLSVDVYSYGILLWELFTAKKPFKGYSASKHMSRVVIDGERPKMDSSTTNNWPMELHWLVERCWSTEPAVRPSFTVIKNTLCDILYPKEAHRQIAMGVAGSPSGPPIGGFASLMWGKNKTKLSKSRSDRSEEFNKKRTAPMTPGSPLGSERSAYRSGRAKSWGFLKGDSGAA